MLECAEFVQALANAGHSEHENLAESIIVETSDPASLESNEVKDRLAGNKNCQADGSYELVSCPADT